MWSKQGKNVLLFSFVKTELPYVAQTGLKFMVFLLIQPPLVLRFQVSATLSWNGLFDV